MSETSLFSKDMDVAVFDSWNTLKGDHRKRVLGKKRQVQQNIGSKVPSTSHEHRTLVLGESFYRLREINLEWRSTSHAACQGWLYGRD